MQHRRHKAHTPVGPAHLPSPSHLWVSAHLCLSVCLSVCVCVCFNRPYRAYRQGRTRVGLTIQIRTWQAYSTGHGRRVCVCVSVCVCVCVCDSLVVLSTRQHQCVAPRRVKHSQELHQGPVLTGHVHHNGPASRKGRGREVGWPQGRERCAAHRCARARKSWLAFVFMPRAVLPQVAVPA